MASEWQVVRLGDAITLKRGYDLPNQARMAGDVPIVSSSGVSGFHSEAKVRAPGIVTGRYGTIGQVHFIENDFWPLNTTLYVQDFKGNLPRFVKYLLQTIDYNQFSDKAAVPGVNRNDLHEAKISLPPLVEQRAIAETLGALDDRIDNLHRTNATLEAITAALFKSWFVDFDGVPPEDMQESKMDMIPKRWRMGTFAETVEILGGGTPKTSIADYWNGDIPWFSVVDAPASGQVFVLDTEKKITSLGLDNCSAKLLPEMTTIISARGTVGKVALTGVPMAMNQSCYALRPKQQGGEAFVYFSTLRFVEHLQRIAHGAVFDTITRDSFKQITTCLPPGEVIAEFAVIANPMLERIRANGQQAATLAALRDTLLPRLISGQLRANQ